MQKIFDNVRGGVNVKYVVRQKEKQAPSGLSVKGEEAFFAFIIL